MLAWTEFVSFLILHARHLFGRAAGPYHGRATYPKTRESGSHSEVQQQRLQRDDFGEEHRGGTSGSRRLPPGMTLAPGFRTVGIVRMGRGQGIITTHTTTSPTWSQTWLSCRKTVRLQSAMGKAVGQQGKGPL
ncbi:hypothetical protein B0I35DRAFT_61138 [Stachybotrys elegans]|uniref:Secreted protein n=1 Tax=Stachybotrys elegans TaxID=80388 RepID=A0A8K0SR75_9HYPO|nr:hypothetical protein B0I35DRAFT_61138 [Stachybotrys elegans]